MDLKELQVEITKDQLLALNKAFIPHKKDFVKMSFVDSNIVFEGIDQANTTKITIGNESVKPEYIGISFFISKAIFAKLEEVMGEKAKFIFEFDGQIWHTLKVEIKGDTLQIGLPIFDEVIITGYEVITQEQVSAETIVEALRCVEASVVPNSEVLACMEIGKKVTFGSSQSIATYNKQVMQTLETKITEDFRKYLANLCKIGDMITIINGKSTDGKSIVVLKCENVEYMSILSAHRLPNMENLVTGSLSKFKIQIAELQDSLARLAIPLMDEDAEIVMVVEGTNLVLSVYDLQHRHSGSKVAIVEATGEQHARASVNIKALTSVISVLENDTEVQYGTNPENEVTALIFDDSKQRTYLVTNIE